MDNKHRARAIVEALAQGSRQPLFDAMREDVTWRWMGADTWSRTFVGKEQVIGELFGGVNASLDSSGSTTTVHGIYGDGAHVVIEHTGSNQTPDGRRYDNNYCWVLEFDTEGKIVALREYMDTQLVTEIFDIS